MFRLNRLRRIDRARQEIPIRQRGQTVVDAEEEEIERMDEGGEGNLNGGGVQEKTSGREGELDTPPPPQIGSDVLY